MAERAVFFPTGGMDNASARTRLYHFLPFLLRHGVRCHVASYTYHRYQEMAGEGHRWTWRRLWLEMLPLRTLVNLVRADVVWFQKLSAPHWALHLAWLLAKRIVYDLDDAIYLQPPASDGQREHAISVNARGQRAVETAMRKADAVVVSGGHLAEFARNYASRVVVLPTATERVSPEPSVAPDPPVIVWVGAPENLRYVLAMEDVLLRLQGEIPDLTIRLVTSRLVGRPRFRHEFIQWSRQAEEEWIGRATVGIAPLADDAWCRAKMNYKALVYLSHGVPAVISPGGFPLQEFREGDSILVARSEDDWYRHLLGVLQDPELRQRLAASGMAVTRKRLTASVLAATWISGLLGRSVPAATRIVPRRAIVT